MNNSKSKLVISIAIIITLIFLWNMSRERQWEAATYALEEEAIEHIVFKVALEQGDKILFRLDAKPGAEDKAKLVLEIPNSENFEWIWSYQQSNKQAEVEVKNPGTYCLILMTESNPKIGTQPEIEVNWKI